jgi:two-component system cell cycle response regulator
MKILVAEDDAISRTLLSRTLLRAGYETIAVENGQEALAELMKEGAPRIALLDWVMPLKDGVEVCREIRRRNVSNYTYLILVSSRESTEDIVAGLEAGADDYITKPCNTDELKARLRTGLRILQLEDRLVEARESMRFKATHDVLTTLWNRGAILELLSMELGRSRREASCTAVMMCDIDHFKSINDRFGHAAGDDVLRDVSKRFQNAVRTYDMVGRYGGEEFLIILNGCDSESAVSRAEDLRQAIGGKPITTGSEALQVTVSLGLALSSDYRGCSVEEIVHEADTALYAAKESGRNCVRTANPALRIKKDGPSHPEAALLAAET